MNLRRRYSSRRVAGITALAKRIVAEVAELQHIAGSINDDAKLFDIMSKKTVSQLVQRAELISFSKLFEKYPERCQKTYHYARNCIYYVLTSSTKKQIKAASGNIRIIVYYLLVSGYQDLAYDLIKRLCVICPAPKLLSLFTMWSIWLQRFDRLKKIALNTNLNYYSLFLRYRFVWKFLINSLNIDNHTVRKYSLRKYKFPNQKPWFAVFRAFTSQMDYFECQLPCKQQSDHTVSSFPCHYLIDAINEVEKLWRTSSKSDTNDVVRRNSSRQIERIFYRYNFLALLSEMIASYLSEVYMSGLHGFYQNKLNSWVETVFLTGIPYQILKATNSVLLYFSRLRLQNSSIFKSLQSITRTICFSKLTARTYIPEARADDRGPLHRLLLPSNIYAEVMLSRLLLENVTITALVQYKNDVLGRDVYDSRFKSGAARFAEIVNIFLASQHICSESSERFCLDIVKFFMDTQCQYRLTWVMASTTTFKCNGLLDDLTAMEIFFNKYRHVVHRDFYHSICLKLFSGYWQTNPVKAAFYVSFVYGFDELAHLAYYHGCSFHFVKFDDYQSMLKDWPIELPLVQIISDLHNNVYIVRNQRNYGTLICRLDGHLTESAMETLSLTISDSDTALKRNKLNLPLSTPPLLKELAKKSNMVRSRIDQQLADKLFDLKTSLFGPYYNLLIPFRSDDDVGDIRDVLETEFRNFELNNAAISGSVIQYLANLWALVLYEDFLAIILVVAGSTRAHSICNKLLTTKMPSAICSKATTCLILPPLWNGVPIEIVAGGKDKKYRFIRHTSFFTLWHYNKQKSLPRTISIKNSYLLVDPENDFPRTIERYKNMVDSDQCILQTAVFPKIDEIMTALQSEGFYIYAGEKHGNNVAHFTDHGGINVDSVCLLLGCKSALIKAVDNALVMPHPITTLLANGSPVVVGCLWNVSDVDIDRFARQFLSTAIPRLIKPSVRLDVGQNNDLVSALYFACRSTTFPLLTGASVVMYGYPVDIKDALSQR